VADASTHFPPSEKQPGSIVAQNYINSFLFAPGKIGGGGNNQDDFICLLDLSE